MKPKDNEELTQAILAMAAEMRAARKQKASEFEWLKSHFTFATKQDLKEMTDAMAIKLSELKGEVAGLRGQVQKIWTEQQGKYDALVIKYDELVKTLENQELDPEAEAEVVAFKADLKAFDDTIPDTTA